MRLVLRTAILPIGLLAAAAVSARADQTPAFEGRTEVTVVEVPVNVLSRAGESVRGLTADDFELYDNGDRRAITQLEVIDLDVLQPSDDTERRVMEEALPSIARRHFLFLFDLSFSSPTAILKARLAARRFVLESLHPTDLAAVALYTLETGPRLLVTFTPDRAQLAHAIDTLGAPRLLADNRLRTSLAGFNDIADPLRFLIDSPRDSGGDLASSGLLGRDGTNLAASREAEVLSHLRVVGKQIEKSRKAYERGRVTAWSRSLGEMAHILASVPGRKHVIYFSQGFDGRLLLGRQPDNLDGDVTSDTLDIQRGNLWMVDTDDIYGNGSLQNDVAQMLEEFRRADCIIQAVDIGGLSADSLESDRTHRVGQDALFYIADATGGELYEDANDFGLQLSHALERSAVTYILTFHAADIPHDGSYRRLKVKLADDRPVRISHRAGYYAPRPFADIHPLEKSLLASEAIASAEPRHDLETDVLVAPFRAGEGRAYVPVIIEVKGDSLLAGQNDDDLAVEFYSYVTDERGEMRDFFTQMVSMDLAAAGVRRSMAASGLKFYGHLELDPGRYLIRVLVRNAASGRTGVETVPLDIPPYEGRRTVLLPPFFVEEPGTWFLVREKQATQDARGVVYPFTVNGEPYVPAARPALHAGEEANLCLVAYNLGRSPAVRGQVLGEAGERVEGGAFDLVERTVTGIDGFDKLLARFRPQGLGPGRYTLQVAVEDPASGESEVSSIPFSVLN